MASKSEFESKDGTTRKTYYGADGRQPWDYIKAEGWGAAFAAGNVLKYMKRAPNKGDRADDTKKAQWYWAELNKLAEMPEKPTGNDAISVRRAKEAIGRVVKLLTKDEYAELVPPINPLKK